jgi:GNAT superfamily N-acetyltransferase
MIIIRKGKKEDCESIWHVHIRAIRKVCGSHYTQKEIDGWTAVLKPMRYRNAIISGTLLVAVNGEAIIGFGNLNRESGEVEAMYVDPDCVKLGVGTRLLRALERMAQDAGLTSIHLSSSLNAVPFYERAGYMREKHPRYLLPFGMVACVPMIKRLSPPGQEPYE